MNRALTMMIAAGLMATAAACTDSKRAKTSATWNDRPADVVCWSYGVEMFNGRSTGKVEHSDNGRVSLVDAKSGRFTTINGDCRVIYSASAK